MTIFIPKSKTDQKGEGELIGIEQQPAVPKLVLLPLPLWPLLQRRHQRAGDAAGQAAGPVRNQSGRRLFVYRASETVLILYDQRCS
jgi:hypothetical protein